VAPAAVDDLGAHRGVSLLAPALARGEKTCLDSVEKSKRC
jgi:hypothetical protein